jgi:hypothetical protein
MKPVSTHTGLLRLNVLFGLDALLVCISEFVSIFFHQMCRDSSVVIATRLRVGQPRNRCSIPLKARFFLFSSTGTHPASYNIATGGCFLGA